MSEGLENQIYRESLSLFFQLFIYTEEYEFHNRLHTLPIT